jgi:hypothetical protein
MSTKCDQNLNQMLMDLSNKNTDKNYKVQLGKTMCNFGWFLKAFHFRYKNKTKTAEYNLLLDFLGEKY